MRAKPEPMQVIKERRDGALLRLVQAVPYIGFMGINFDRRGDELTATMAYSDMLIGNPAFLEQVDSIAINLSGQSLGNENFLNYVVAKFQDIAKKIHTLLDYQQVVAGEL